MSEAEFLVRSLKGQVLEQLEAAGENLQGLTEIVYDERGKCPQCFKYLKELGTVSAVRYPEHGAYIVYALCHKCTKPMRRGLTIPQNQIEVRTKRLESFVINSVAAKA